MVAKLFTPMFALSLAAMIPGTAVHGQEPPPVARTEAGSVSGVMESGQAVFKGIPYAAAPTGALRWRAPQSVKSWAGVRKADHFGAICRQPAMPMPGSVQQAQSEDCLFLNIFRPVGNTQGLPVLFWIPGGGLVAGSGSEPLYDGKALARQGFVVVTINYRVGRFGFFAHPELTKENPDNGRFYNYGLMDEIAALQWVRRNITSFGGDPAKVTIFGESAGGASVNALMISPPARGLFAAAITESGYGRGSYPRISERSADGDAPVESTGTTLAAKLGMPGASLSQLRQVSGDRIIATFDRNEEIIFAVDGTTLTSDLWPAFAKNMEAPVPFIVGSNSYEMGMMKPEEQRPWAQKVVPAARWDGLTPYYDNDPALRDRLLLSDIIYATQVRAIASRHATNGHPTYVYRFDVPSSFAGAKLPGAMHGSELPFVFGNFRPGTVPTADDGRVSKTMMAYWANFARTGDPNGPGLTTWPRYKDHVLLHITPTSDAAAEDPLLARINAIDAAASDILPD